MQNDEHHVTTRDEDQLTTQAPRAVAERLHFSPALIQETQQEIAIMQEVIRSTLSRGIDYGRIPGTPKDSLWDPGANMIAGAFNCYFGNRRILKLEDTEKQLSAIVEVPIISRLTGNVVGTGIGAASTNETKYKYRWVDDEEGAALGYPDEALKTFKSKRAPKGGVIYRIPNPEHQELLNTIIKQASKRGETDAVNVLPGIATVLRQMFDSPDGRRKEERAGAQAGQKITTWDAFWGEVRRMGLTSDDVYELLGVPHVKEWLDTNKKNLDECLQYILTHHLNGHKAPETHREATPPPDDDNLGVAWDEVCKLLEELKPDQEGLQRWWNQYNVIVLVADFKPSAEIPDKFKADHILAFRKSLRELKEQRARKQRKPAAKTSSLL